MPTSASVWGDNGDKVEAASMDTGYLGSVLFVLAYPGLPIALILTPLVRKLWTADQRQGRAMEEFLLSLGVLAAPWLILMGMQATGLAPHRGEGWFVAGLFIAVPLWVTGMLLLRLAPGMIRLVRRTLRRPAPGGLDWGTAPEGIPFYLLALVVALLALMLTCFALEISLAPNPG